MLLRVIDLIVNTNPSYSVTMYEEHLSKLTVPQLKEELSSRELETTGKKADLVQRLNQYLEGMLSDIIRI